MVYEVLPEPETMGNGLQAVGWSPDGRKLALNLHLWQPHSDFFDSLLLIFNTEDWRQPEVINFHDLFTKHFGRKCTIRLVGVDGFSQEGTVLIKVSDYYDVYEPEENTTCIGQETSQWSLRLEMGNLAKRGPKNALR